MSENRPDSGGRRNRWPLDLDHRDPEGIAAFLLGLDYAPDAVINALVTRCNLDSITARRIVSDVQTQPGGTH